MDEPATEETQLERPRYLKNLDIKREARREYVYFNWLRGRTIAEIAEMVDINPSTVYEDLKKIRAQLNMQPRSMEQIRSEALISLRLTHADIQKTIKEAKAKGAPYNQIKGLFAELSSIDKTILHRYTPVASAPEITSKANDQIKAMIDYMTETYGPESLAGFQEWWSKRMDVMNTVRNTTK